MTSVFATCFAAPFSKFHIFILNVTLHTNDPDINISAKLDFASGKRVLRLYVTNNGNQTKYLVLTVVTAYSLVFDIGYNCRVIKIDQIEPKTTLRYDIEVEFTAIAYFVTLLTSH